MCYLGLWVDSFKTWCSLWARGAWRTVRTAKICQKLGLGWKNRKNHWSYLLLQFYICILIMKEMKWNYVQWICESGEIAWKNLRDHFRWTYFWHFWAIYYIVNTLCRQVRTAVPTARSSSTTHSVHCLCRLLCFTYIVHKYVLCSSRLI